MASKKPTIPYQDANAAAPLAELERVLAKFGCTAFGTMTDTDRGVLIVQFRHRGREVSVEASWVGYAAAWKKVKPPSGRFTGAQYNERAIVQAKTSVACCLRDWLKGQLTAVECGVMSFEAAFMPHMMLASGQRVLDHLQTNNLLPPPTE
jgi:hypothetical protein